MARLHLTSYFRVFILTRIAVCALRAARYSITLLQLLVNSLFKSILVVLSQETEAFNCFFKGLLIVLRGILIFNCAWCFFIGRLLAAKVLSELHSFEEDIFGSFDLGSHPAINLLSSNAHVSHFSQSYFFVELSMLDRLHLILDSGLATFCWRSQFLNYWGRHLL